jgi:glucuronosyltransferase
MIKIVLSFFSFIERVSILSQMWRDQPLSAQEVGSHWIESLLKFGQMRHLKINDYDLTWWQYFSIDVILFMILSMVIIASAIFCLCRKFYFLSYSVSRIKIKIT